MEAMTEQYRWRSSQPGRSRFDKLLLARMVPEFSAFWCGKSRVGPQALQALRSSIV